MKQRLLFVLASLMICLGAMADEWVHPVPAHSDIVYGDTVYLYNADAKSFFLGANYWNTRASVSTDKGYKCVLALQEDGTVTIQDSVETATAMKYLWASAIDNIWVDYNTEGCIYWKFVAQGDGSYFIYNNQDDLKDYPLGTDQTRDNTTILYLNDTEMSATEAYNHWYIVTPEAYKNYFEAYDTYAAATALKAKIDEAQELGLSTTEADAVYANTSSTLEQLTAAKANVQAIINNYKENLATPDNPQDITNAYIPDADFELNQGAGVWQRTHSAQNWQTSGTPNKMGDSTYFLESWNGSNFKGKMYVPITGLPNGVYQFTLSVATNGTAATYVYAGSDSVEVTTGSTMTPYTVFTKVENDSLEVGYYLPTASQGWVGIDDAKLLYFGNSKDSYAYWVKYMMENAPKYDDETFAQASLIAEYNKLIETDPYSLGSVDEVLAYYETYKAKLAEVKANVVAYATYKELGQEIDDLSAAGYQGDEADAIYDYKTETYEEIVSNKALSTEEMIAETDKVKAMIDVVKTNCLAPGMDCTNLLTNPNFTTGLDGWSYDSNYAEPAWGGLESNPDCEKWNDNFDFYQTRSNVPNGVYELKVQAFYRPTGSTSGSYSNYIADPNTDEILAYIYGNDTKKAVCNIAAYSYSENLENNCETCTDANGNTVYVPNGMNSASNAFARGDYDNTLQFIVTDGNLKVGITSTEGTTTGRWTLWDNFRLTYLGMDETVLSNLLAETKESAAEYLESPMGATELDALQKAYEAEPTTGQETFDAIQTLNAAVDNAKASIAAYEKLSTAIEDLSTAVDTYKEAASYNDASDLLNDVSTKYGEGAYTVAETEETIVKINTAIAKLKVPTETGDWTTLIINPAYDEGNADGWNYKFTTSGNIGYQNNSTYTNGDVTLSQFIECWRNGVAIGDGSINQTIYYLPAGSYTLAVDAMATLQTAAESEVDEKVTGVYLYAMQDGQVIRQVEIKTYNEAPQHFTLDFPVATAGAVEIGIMTKDATANWIAADNWTLTCTSSDPSTSINTVATTSTTAAGIYTIAGARLSKMQRGINIVNGKKMFVK